MGALVPLDILARERQVKNDAEGVRKLLHVGRRWMG